MSSLVAKAAKQGQLVEMPAPVPNSLGFTMFMQLSPLWVSLASMCTQATDMHARGATRWACGLTTLLLQRIPGFHRSSAPSVHRSD